MELTAMKMVNEGIFIESVFKEYLEDLNQYINSIYENMSWTLFGLARHWLQRTWGLEAKPIFRVSKLIQKLNCL